VLKNLRCVAMRKQVVSAEVFVHFGEVKFAPGFPPGASFFL